MCLMCPGDYEKLWGAVTGGRGTGRGKKRTKPKDKEAVPTGFGKKFFCKLKRSSLVFGIKL